MHMRASKPLIELIEHPLGKGELPAEQNAKTAVRVVEITWTLFAIRPWGVAQERR
jgi:hypothetical protein